MAKHEIEIPDGVIPNGWEPVSFGIPANNVAVVAPCGSLALAHCLNSPRLILRKIEPVRETRWRNVYPLHMTNPCAAYYETRKLAVAAQLGEPGKRVERIDYENGVPVSVTLEPLPAGEGE